MPGSVCERDLKSANALGSTPDVIAPKTASALAFLSCERANWASAMASSSFDSWAFWRASSATFMLRSRSLTSSAAACSKALFCNKESLEEVWLSRAFCAWVSLFWATTARTRGSVPCSNPGLSWGVAASTLALNSSNAFWSTPRIAASRTFSLLFFLSSDRATSAWAMASSSFDSLAFWRASSASFIVMSMSLTSSAAVTSNALNGICSFKSLIVLSRTIARAGIVVPITAFLGGGPPAPEPPKPGNMLKSIPGPPLESAERKAATSASRPATLGAISA